MTSPLQHSIIYAEQNSMSANLSFIIEEQKFKVDTVIFLNLNISKKDSRIFRKVRYSHFSTIQRILKCQPRKQKKYEK